MPTNYAQQTEPQTTVLAWTVDKIDAGSQWRNEIEAALKERDGELVALDLMDVVYRDGLLEEAEYSFCVAGKIELAYDDGPEAVRRKFVAELLALAQRIGGTNG